MALPIAPLFSLLAFGAGLLVGSRAVTAVRRNRAPGAPAGPATQPAQPAPQLMIKGSHPIYGCDRLIIGRDPQPLGGALAPTAGGQPGPAHFARLRHDTAARTGASPVARARPRQDAHLSAGLRVGVLGPLTINARSGGLLPAQSQLLVALALHGRTGTANRMLCRMLGADPDHPRPSDSLRQLIVRTRRQLGRAPDGAEWIEHLGGGQYALHPAARLDWHEFGELAALGLGTSDSAPLAQAMRLVRGQPLADCWYWWLDLGLVEAMRTRIVDVAAALADLALAAQDHAAAARTARAGLLADPSAERLWRLLMRAEHAAGNLAGVREAWAQCLTAIADIAADGQPEQATCGLRRELMGNGAN